MNSVEVYNLTKIFNPKFKNQKVVALKDLSLSVSKGSIFGLLGPNGAGKTTLIKILLGITFPTLGSAKILGSDLSNYRIKKQIGYLPENHKFPNYLTGEQALRYFAKLSDDGINEIDKKIEQLLTLVKMDKWKKTKVKKYSKGMMQRLGLAQALINDPDLIFLDEPTDGVDPIGRKEIRDVLLDLKNRGKTIFLNSHLLSEVELITDRVAILNKGELIKEGTVEDLTTTKELYEIQIETEISHHLIEEILNEFSISRKDGNTISVRLENHQRLNVLIDTLRKQDIMINSIVPQKNTLEDMFISLIHEAEDKKVE